MIFNAYRLATTALGPLIYLHLNRRVARGKEDKERLCERLGRAGRSRPEGLLFWVHAASVGESLSMLPLVARLLERRPGLSILVTTGTVTSARLMAERLPKGAFHQYVPIDRMAWVQRFLDHWRPDLALWAESEFWPNLVGAIGKRRIPMILVNGRVSGRSFAKWRKYPRFIRQLLSAYTLCLGQTQADAERLSQLGAVATKHLGNLKLAAPALPADQEELKRLSALFAGRPRWLAASTHVGEEALVGRAHTALANAHPGLLTLVVPRHPERGSSVAKELRSQGLCVARRGAGQEPKEATDIYLADTLGELGLFFRLADVVFMGKSLTPLGGQNPIEPARLGRPVLHGPHMANFAEIAVRMKEVGASQEVHGESGLVAALDTLLGDPDACDRLSAAAKSFATAEAGVLDAVIDEVLCVAKGATHG